MPTKVPITPERMMVRQYCSTSRILGITVSKGLIFGTGRFSCMATRISAKPKAPTSAGTSEKPPARSRLSKLKRSKAWMPSWPMVAMNSPAMPVIQPLSASPPVSVAEMMTPKIDSQKNS